jgi:RNA polymerase sigma-70 factor (ECF subfamily)
LRKKKPIYSDDVPEQIDGQADGLATLEQAETAKHVRLALSKLPEMQKAAMTLSYYQGVSQKEGAAILGYNEKAYESLLSRGRKNLKAALRPLIDNELI